MSVQTQVSFNVPTTNTDGSAITEALSYSVLIDTVNPPVKSYAVPAAVVAVAGVVTVTFAQLGFVPVKNTDYFATATATDADGTSAMSADFAFAYSVVPNAPTGLKVG
jgi:hypothetical protein